MSNSLLYRIYNFQICLPLKAQQRTERGDLNLLSIIYEHIQHIIYSLGITRKKSYPKFPK